MNNSGRSRVTILYRGEGVMRSLLSIVFLSAAAVTLLLCAGNGSESAQPGESTDTDARGQAVMTGADGETGQAASLPLDEFLGVTTATLPATGYFRVEQRGERWFLVTPKGHPFFIIGLNGVTPWYGTYRKVAFTKKYRKDFTAWANTTVRRIKSWGFNTLGYKTADQLVRAMIAGKVAKMPYTVVLPFIENIAHKRSTFPDVFSAAFEAHADSVARRYVTKLAEDPYLVGYYLCNEPDLDLTPPRNWRSRWVRNLIKSGAGSPGFEAFRDLVKKKYTSVEAFNQEHGTSISSFEAMNAKDVKELESERKGTATQIVREFNALIARRFCRVTAEAVRKYDSNHLILGMRFGGGAERRVIEETAPCFDVMSFNKYTKQLERSVELFESAYRIAEKPLIHTEFSFLMEGRNGASDGASYPPVPSQQARGEYYRTFVEREFRLPYIIGVSWHEFTDPSPETNFGLVNAHDEEYTAAVSIISETNRKLVATLAEVAGEVTAEPEKGERSSGQPAAEFSDRPATE